MDIKTAKQFEGGKGMVWLISKGQSGCIGSVDEEKETAICSFHEGTSKIDEFPLDLIETIMNEPPDSDLYPPYHEDYYRDKKKWERQHPTSVG